MLREHTPLFTNKNIIRGGIASLLLASTLSCSSAAEHEMPTTTPITEPTRSEAHFAITCPANSTPGITEVADSGVMPKRNEKVATAIVRVACFSSEGALKRAPIIAQDLQHDGDCLGYGKDYHLSMDIEKITGKPEFFTTQEGEIALVGGANYNDSKIVGAEIHHHDDNDTKDAHC